MLIRQNLLGDVTLRVELRAGTVREVCFRARAGCVAVICGFCMSLLSASLVFSAPGAGPETRGAGAGTIETVAAPDFCSGPSRPDSSSGLFNALALDSSGRVAVDAGRPGRGEIALVAPTGETRLLRTGVAVAPDPLSGASGPDPPVLPASRLASDGRGGFLIAAGTRIDMLESSGLGISTAFGAASDPMGRKLKDLGDGGPAENASFSAITAVSTDPEGNVYVADTWDASKQTVRIRFINRSPRQFVFYDGTPDRIEVPPGSIDTIAGATVASAGNRAVKSLVQGRPPAMAVSGQMLYLASFRNPPGTAPARSELFAINLGARDAAAAGRTVASGAIERIGGGPAGFRGDGGPASEARFSFLPAIAATPEGDLLLADRDNHRIRRVDRRGVVGTFAGRGPAGAGGGGFAGNDGPAVGALLDGPFDVEVGARGRVYISDRNNGRVRWVDAGGAIRAAPGGGAALRWICSGPPGRTSSRPAGVAPRELAADSRGNVYFVGPGVRRLEPSGFVTRVRGEFGRPVAIASAPNGVYVRDAAGVRILFANFGRDSVWVHGVRVDPGEVGVVAGRGRRPPFRKADSGPYRGKALAADLADQGGIASDGSGNLFVGEPEGVLLRIDAKGRISPADAVERRPPECPSASGLGSGEPGIVYLAGSDHVCALNISKSSRTIHGVAIPPGNRRRVAGSGKRGLGGDSGPALEAGLNVSGVVADDRSNLYIADSVQHIVSKVDGEGKISRVAGTGQAGFNGDGLKGPVTSLSFPFDVAVDACGDLLIADTDNDRIRRLITGSSSCVPPAGSAAGGTTEAPRSSPWTVLAAGVILAGVLWAAVRFRKVPKDPGGPNTPGSASVF